LLVVVDRAAIHQVIRLVLVLVAIEQQQDSQSLQVLH
jgi:hypothetical protein